MRPRLGVVALQGDFREHAGVLRRMGAEVREVRRPSELVGIDGLVIPGGESTTIGKLAVRVGLLEPLRVAIAHGLPTYGSCAGMILLAASVTEGEQPLLGALDVVVQRNAFGRQNESFEADLDVVGFDRPLHAVFIRAPWIVKVGGEVDVLATVDEHPVMVRQGRVLATAFHPELVDDHRVHEMLFDMLS